jgi:O-antigen biosynthesis protein
VRQNPAAPGNPVARHPSSAPAVALPADPRNMVHLGSSAAHRYRPRLTGSRSWLTLLVKFAPDGVMEAVAEFRFRDGRKDYAKPIVIARNTFAITLRARSTLEEIVLHVEGSGDILQPVRAELTSASTMRKFLSLAGIASRRLVRSPKRFLSSAVWFLERLALSQTVSLPAARVSRSPAESYDRWRELFDDEPETDPQTYAAQGKGLAARPTISVLFIAKTAEELETVLSNMAAQLYPGWELIVVAPPDADVPAAGFRGDRISFVTGTASTRATCLNDALRAAKGEIILPLPSGARLRPHALLECAMAFAVEPRTTILYADEDLMTSEGRRVSPRFKPAWSPHYAACHDYMGDPVFFDARALRSAGGWREGIPGAEDHDLRLRVADLVAPETIVHLAKVLLHRTESDGTSAFSETSRLQVVSDHLLRRGIPGRVVPDERSPHPRIVRTLVDPPLVSIIVPTRDSAALLRMCIASVLARTCYPEFEILVVDNGSRERETFETFRELERDDRVSVLAQPGPFNYSALNNAAVREARGQVLALVNNDIEVVSSDWLEEMVGHALEPDVGCVGAKLLYPDGTIQHGGIVTGLLGGAGHSDKHAPQGAAGYLDRLVTTREVSAVTGACLIVRRSLYEVLGGLDEETFGIAFNDVDFCLRAAAAGYRTIWTPFAELIHHESVSRGHDLRDRAKARRLATELSALQSRWGPRLLADPYHSPHLDPHSEAFGIRVS